MARFDLYARPEGDGYFVDCQADLLRDLNSRFVVPVLKPDKAPKPAGRLNPAFLIMDQPYIMVTQFAGAVPKNELRAACGSLIDHDVPILAALDLLIVGY